MNLRELLEYSKEDLANAKSCADEITNILNKHDLKPILVEAVLSQFLDITRKEINERIQKRAKSK